MCRSYFFRLRTAAMAALLEPTSILPKMLLRCVFTVLMEMLSFSVIC